MADNNEDPSKWPPIDWSESVDNIGKEIRRRMAYYQTRSFPPQQLLEDFQKWKPMDLERLRNTPERGRDAGEEDDDWEVAGASGGASGRTPGRASGGTYDDSSPSQYRPPMTPFRLTPGRSDDGESDVIDWSQPLDQVGRDIRRRMGWPPGPRYEIPRHLSSELRKWEQLTELEGTDNTDNNDDDDDDDDQLRDLSNIPRLDFGDSDEEEENTPINWETQLGTEMRNMFNYDSDDDVGFDPLDISSMNDAINRIGKFGQTKHRPVRRYERDMIAHINQQISQREQQIQQCIQTTPHFTAPNIDHFIVDPDNPSNSNGPNLFESEDMDLMRQHISDIYYHYALNNVPYPTNISLYLDLLFQHLLTLLEDEDYSVEDERLWICHSMLKTDTMMTTEEVLNMIIEFREFVTEEVPEVDELIKRCWSRIRHLWQLYLNGDIQRNPQHYMSDQGEDPNDYIFIPHLGTDDNDHFIIDADNPSGSSGPLLSQSTDIELMRQHVQRLAKYYQFEVCAPQHVMDYVEALRQRINQLLAEPANRHSKTEPPIHMLPFAALSLLRWVSQSYDMTLIRQLHRELTIAFVNSLGTNIKESHSWFLDLILARCHDVHAEDMDEDIPHQFMQPDPGQEQLAPAYQANPPPYTLPGCRSYPPPEKFNTSRPLPPQYTLPLRTRHTRVYTPQTVLPPIGEVDEELEEDNYRLAPRRRSNAEIRGRPLEHRHWIPPADQSRQRQTTQNQRPPSHPTPPAGHSRRSSRRSATPLHQPRQGGRSQ